MTCKDCIHYTAHKHFYFDEEDFDEYFNDDNVESQCPEFKDKSEWVKLPCKVGDSVYRLEYDRYANSWQVYRTDYATKHDVIEWTLFGAALFKTREDAEKALAKVMRGEKLDEDQNKWTLFDAALLKTREAAEKALAERSGK